MYGRRIKELRKHHKITQLALGEMLGVTQQSVGKWEREDTEPDIRNLLRMADIFGVSVDNLLGRGEPSTQRDEEPHQIDFDSDFPRSRSALKLFIIDVFNELQQDDDVLTPEEETALYERLEAQIPDEYRDDCPRSNSGGAGR